MDYNNNPFPTETLGDSEKITVFFIILKFWLKLRRVDKF
jgi:hypothetical protein